MYDNLAMDVPLQDFTSDREQRDRSVVLASDLFSVFGIGTTVDVFQELGNLPVVIERFNNLV